MRGARNLEGGANVFRARSVPHLRVFVSMSNKDKRWVEGTLIDLLRRHFIETWYWRDPTGAGRLQAHIAQGLDGSDFFLLVLSPNSVASGPVHEEIALAIANPKFQDRIIPVLLEACDFSKLPEEFLKRNYRYFVVDGNPHRFQGELLHALGAERHPMDEWHVGSVILPIFVLVGGDGHIRYQWPDGIVCEPTSNVFEGHPDLKQFKEKRVAAALASAAATGSIIENRPMTRLEGYSWGLRSPDDAEWPLRLKIGRTDYFTQLATNAVAQDRLPSGKTIIELYGGRPEEFQSSFLANPLATNLSIVTSDGFTFVAKRGSKVMLNKGGFAPAVSGTGNPERDMEGGIYSPFVTAKWEASEEALRPLVPDVRSITFFGLARTARYRFPFLFGELRTHLTAAEVGSLAPSWENRGRVAIPFTVEDVLEWVRGTYSNYVANRGAPGDTTAMFSLLQSLQYEYPDRWIDVARGLEFDPRA